MKAAVFRGRDVSIGIEDMPTPRLREGEILVRVVACALCRSDLHTVFGRRAEPTPTILGHEIVGRIESFGPEAPRQDAAGNPLSIGTRVTWAIVVGCGECAPCRNGLPQKCDCLFKYGHAKETETETLSGGLASHVVLRKRTAIYVVPEPLSDSIAALANCSTATAIAVLRAADTVENRSVLIFGAGILGLTAAAIASSRGAKRIVVRDPNAASLARAAQFGSSTLDESGEFDVVLELSGSAQAASACLDACRIGGTIVFAGTVSPVGSISVDPERFVRRCLKLVGVHNYQPDDLGIALEFLSGAGQQFPFGDFIADTIPLEKISEAFERAENMPGRRIVVTP